MSRIPWTHWTVTTCNWHRPRPKTSGANPVNAKPVEGEQESQMMRDEKGKLDFIVREERKTDSMIVNILNI